MILELIPAREKIKLIDNGTLPCGHLGPTVTLLLQLYFFCLGKKATHFMLMRSPVIAAKGHILRSEQQNPFDPVNMATHGNASVHSSCAHLPPRQLQGICQPCQSRRGGILADLVRPAGRALASLKGYTCRYFVEWKFFACWFWFSPRFTLGFYLAYSYVLISHVRKELSHSDWLFVC